MLGRVVKKLTSILKMERIIFKMLVFETLSLKIANKCLQIKPK